MLTDYTAYDSVRVVLGVSSRIFPDSSLASEIYDLALRMELSRIDADLDQAYLDLIDESMSLAPAAQNFYNAVRLFAAHYVAFKALTAMPEMSPALVGDSKATMRKDQAAVAQRVAGEYSTYRSLLASAYATYAETAAPPTFQPSMALVSTPDFDPVTGV